MNASEYLIWTAVLGIIVGINFRWGSGVSAMIGMFDFILLIFAFMRNVK